MSDNTLSVRRRQPKPSETAADAPFSGANLRSGAYESFLGAAVPGIGDGVIKGKQKAKPVGDVNEFRVEARRKKRLKQYDKFLKGFKYSAALDSVTKKVICSSIFYYTWELTHTSASTACNYILRNTRTYLQRWSSNSIGWKG
jgi:U3 small nucleolar RNA-associated protein 15